MHPPLRPLSFFFFLFLSPLPRSHTMSNLNKDTEHTNGGGNVEEEVGAHGGAANRGVGGPESCERGAPEPRGSGVSGVWSIGVGYGGVEGPVVGLWG